MQNCTYTQRHIEKIRKKVFHNHIVTCLHNILHRERERERTSSIVKFHNAKYRTISTFFSWRSETSNWRARVRGCACWSVCSNGRQRRMNPRRTWNSPDANRTVSSLAAVLSPRGTIISRSRSNRHRAGVPVVYLCSAAWAAKQRRR